MADMRPFRGRPEGVSSRIRPAENVDSYWQLDDQTSFPMPVIVDFLCVAPGGRWLEWKIEATVGLIEGNPRLIRMLAENLSGIDVEYMQREFLWRSPETIVTRGIPKLLSEGTDPFEFELPLSGFPDAAEISLAPRQRLDDKFLEDIAREYLVRGRGYAASMAAERFVSKRTVVSWIEKARARGILTMVDKGSHGGRIVPISERAQAKQVG